MIGLDALFRRPAKPQATPLPSTLQPNVDLDLPVWVSTDQRVWATTTDPGDAVRFAERLLPTLQRGERLMVTWYGIVIWSGTDLARPPVGKGF